jgi:hypothetical protein
MTPGEEAIFALLHREHLAPDEPLLVAYQQHVAEQLRRILAHIRDERGNGRDMRPAVRRQRHEHHVLLACARNRTARGDAARIRKQDDLEQNRRIVGRRAALVVVAVARRESRQVAFVLDAVRQRVLEGSGQHVAIEVHRNQLRLAVVVVLISGHPQFLGN